MSGCPPGRAEGSASNARVGGYSPLRARGRSSPQEIILDIGSWSPYIPPVSFAEGRQPVTFGGWSEMRRLLPCGSSPPAPGGEGSPSGLHYEGSAFNGWTGARRAGRKPRARGRETALPCRRKHGPDSQKSPRWSAERRARLRQARAASLRRGAATKVRRSALRPPRFVWPGARGRRRTRRLKQYGRSRTAV